MPGGAEQNTRAVLLSLQCKVSLFGRWDLNWLVTRSQRDLTQQSIADGGCWHIVYYIVCSPWRPARPGCQAGRRPYDWDYY